MIALLRGTLIHKRPGQVVIDIQGVGYTAGIPLSTYLKMGDLGEEVALFVHTHVTDSSLSLFGFYSESEKDLFLKLISISGIGPKIALNILSGIEASDLEEAIQNSDIGRISLVPGIGKKTAMRIALELQEKLGKEEKILGTKYSEEREDLISAFTNMGFRRKEVEKIVDETIQSISIEAGFEKLLREGLKRLAKI